MKLNIDVEAVLEKSDPMVKIREAFDKAEILIPQDLQIDGKIHRFRANPDKAHDNLSGWYVFFDTEHPAGAFGDYSRDISAKVNTYDSEEMSPAARHAREEMIRQAREKAESERRELAEKAAKECQEIWEAAPECAKHSYLEKKHLSGTYGTKIYQNKLLLPLYNKDGRLVSLERIDGNGVKRYHANGTCKGSYWKVGSGAPAYLAEGFATAASVYEATGKTCLIAYSAGNLPNIAALFPGVTIVTDNDESGTGEKYSKQTGHPYILIPDKGKDANDYATEHGKQALRDLLEPKTPALKLYTGDQILMMPSPRSWLIKNWLLRGNSFAMIFGASGNGKTFLVVDWMMRIATGASDWCGFKVNQAKVLYLCGEGSLDVRARIAVWCQEHRILNLENFYMSEEAAHIDSAEGMGRVLQSLEYYNFKPELIVVDTLNRFMEGDENDTQSAGAFISACAQLQNLFNASVLIVHHTGLAEDAQKRARGSSAFRGALDMQAMVTKSGDIFSIDQTKNKGGRQQAPVFMELVDHDLMGWMDEDLEQVTCATLEQCENPYEDLMETKISDRNKDRMTDMFVRFGFEDGDFLIIKRDHLKKAFYEDIMERNPDTKKPQQAADMALKRALDPLLDDGSLTPYEKDLSGRVITYKTEGFKGYGNGILEPFFSWNMSRKKVVTTCNS